ncbi:hypothetical protein [Kutzneria albida]|nr:hypothetical protein [Kutzneria albida]
MVRHSHTARSQHLLDELQSLLRHLEHHEPDTEDRDVLLRLAGFAQALLVRHEIDQDGRCQACRPRRPGWTNWLRRRRSAPCLVHSLAVYYCTGPLDEVWWQVLAQLGDHRNPAEVRRWLARPQSSGESALPQQRSVEPAQGRHAVVDQPACSGSAS